MDDLHDLPDLPLDPPDTGLDTADAPSTAPEPVFGSSAPAGINEDTGNTVSIWPGNRPFDDLTWEPVKEK